MINLFDTTSHENGGLFHLVYVHQMKASQTGNKCEWNGIQKRKNVSFVVWLFIGTNVVWRYNNGQRLDLD
jgi:hypothetical protein